MGIILKVLVSAVLLSGCSIGVSVHPNIDRPEIDLDTVLGVARVEKNGFFCEHISALTQVEQGAGLNHCGYMMRLE